MEPFFKTIAVVAALIGVIILISGAYVMRQQRLYRKRAENLKKNDYFNTREYNRTLLNSIILKIRAGEILWVEIFPPNQPGNRLLLNKHPVSKSLSLTFRAPGWNLNDKKRVLTLGAESVLQKASGIMLLIPCNSKITTDVIYYVFEIPMKMVRVFNLKFKF